MLWILLALLPSPALQAQDSPAIGKTWTLSTQNAPFYPRSDHHLLVFNDKLWVMGGHALHESKNDLWSSPDGSHWTQVSAELPIGSRTAYGAAVFKDRLWIIGGMGDDKKDFGDVWSSPDGVQWEKVLSAVPFPLRDGFSCVAFKDQLVILLGRSAYTADYKSTPYSDVWSTPDGIHWKELTNQVPFSHREHPVVLAFQDRLWVISGFAGGKTNDVWSSPDGAKWILVNDKAEFGPRNAAEGAVLDGQLWIVGGHRDAVAYWDNAVLNDTWYSVDGRYWTQASNQAPFSPRMGHALAAFQGKLWMIGGGFLKKSDVWHSP